MSLRARFVRIAGQRDRVYVTRSDGSEAYWQFPSYGDGLPHDLVHLIVEQIYGMKRGFWGRVDAGVDVTRINQMANRNGGKDKYAGFGGDLEELLRAEALANMPWDDQESLPSRLTEAGFDPALATKVRAELGVQRSKWRALGAKGTLEIFFDPE